MQVQKPEARSQKFFKKLFTVDCLLSTGEKGFTLIEIILIIVVVAIAIPALLIVLGQGTQQGVNAELQIRAVNVAQAMMEEIKSKNWDENSPIPPGAYSSPLAAEGETRTACTGTSGTPYDDVDDYNGYTENCNWGGQSYTTSISLCYVSSADLNTCVAGTSDYKRITVTTSNATLGSVELVTLVSNY